jgi:hypothetical protein
VTDFRQRSYAVRLWHARKQCLRYLNGGLTAEELKALPNMQGVIQDPIARKRMNGYIRYVRAYRRHAHF